MKKSILLSAFVMGAVALNAQTERTVLEGNRIGDNWSVGVNAGGVVPLTHSSYIKDARPAFGLGVSKQLTPIFGLGLQGMGYVNTTGSRTAIDASEVSLLGKFNLMNLFGGYTGEPRLFEIEALTGIGWLHYYVNGSGDENAWSTRLGLNMNFNLGEQKAWTLGIKPAIVYDMEGDFNRSKSHFNASNAMFELTAGVAYHFRCSNGQRHFTLVRPYDAAEVADLNAMINDLRMEVNCRDHQLNNAARQVKGLQKELEDCRTKVVPVQTVVKNNRIPESIVTFRQGKSVVDASQLPNVERVASYLQKHADATVSIKGYASPEGNLDLNMKLAASRAEAVKTILTQKYRIDASRIKAEGQGVGDMFSEADWNRVSICTISEGK